jgi:hypothetical protein
MYRYGVDLTAQASKLDPIVGREDEIRRVVRVLCRRTKNNPCLVGDPGVGKTAIVEGKRMLNLENWLCKKEREEQKKKERNINPRLVVDLL